MKYWSAITIIEANRYKMQTKISIMPNVKDAYRDKFIKSLDRLISSLTDRSNEKKVSVEDFAKKLAQRMSGNG